MVPEGTPNIGLSAHFLEPLTDLGQADLRYAGVFTPVSELGLKREGITETFLSGADQWFDRFEMFDQIFALLNPVFERYPAATAGTVVDVGCGFGNTTIPLLAHYPGLSVIATDLSPDLLAILRREAAKRSLIDRCLPVAVDAQRDYFKDGFADAVVGCGVLHHIAEPAKTVGSAMRALRPKSPAIFLEPFEAGHAVLRIMFGQIVAEAESRGQSGPAFDFLAAMSNDIRVRSHRTSLPGWSDKWFDLDDKWLFTRRYLEKMGEDVGASDVRVISLYDRPDLFMWQTKRALTQYGQLKFEDLPDWAWNLVARYDSDFFSDDMKADLFIEAAVVFTR
jgi:SAM-dependent methyltransferase